MDHNMERTNQMLALIHAIIEVADAELERFLRRYTVIEKEIRVSVLFFCTII